MSGLKSLVGKLKIDAVDSSFFVANGFEYSFEEGFFSDLKDVSKEGVFFVDGGNACVFESGCFSLQKIRVCGYGDKVLLDDFFVLAKKVSGGVELFYEPFKDLPSFIEGDLGVGEAVSRVRRYAELIFASQFDCVVLDGSFDYKDDFEYKLIKKIKCGAALSKRSGFHTDKGMPLGWQLLRFAKNRVFWHYYLYQREDVLVGMVKLSKSNYVFRLDIINFDMNLLVANSKDSVFLGYPYGLIMADSYARIENVEVEQIKSELLLDEELLDLNLSVNAHDVLDKLRF